MEWKINKIKGHHYEERAIIGDGHTMFLNDVLNALKRKEYLEAENKELKENLKAAFCWFESELFYEKCGLRDSTKIGVLQHMMNKIRPPKGG